MHDRLLLESTFSWHHTSTRFGASFLRQGQDNSRQRRLRSMQPHSSYGVFTHTSMGGRAVQNQNLQKCVKVVLKWLAEVGPPMVEPVLHTTFSTRARPGSPVLSEVSVEFKQGGTAPIARPPRSPTLSEVSVEFRAELCPWIDSNAVNGCVAPLPNGCSAPAK